MADGRWLVQSLSFESDVGLVAMGDDRGVVLHSCPEVLVANGGWQWQGRLRKSDRHGFGADRLGYGSRISWFLKPIG